MRMRVFLFPNSVPLTAHLCPLVASALLLLLCSTTSCLGNHYLDCHWDPFPCAAFLFVYPFGEKGSGYGDPEFQLDCYDQSGHPLLNISGQEYRILKPPSWDNINGMTIVNDNMFGDKWNLSGNYSQFWRPGSLFQIADGYTNLTLWKHCDQIPETVSRNLSLCGDDWHYSLAPHLNLKPTCNAYQLPIKKNSTEPMDYEALLQQGFEVTWHVDANRSRSCHRCVESKGVCGYNISEPFLCYCRNGSTYQDKCRPHNDTDESHKDTDTGNSNNQTTTSGGRKNQTVIVGIIVGCSVGGFAVIAVALVLFVTYSAKTRKASGCQGPDRNFGKYERKDIEASGPRLKIGHLSIFSYEELRQATNCFHEENEVGDGGFGSVYLGELRDGLIVAVKRLYQDNSRRVGQFINEVAIFSTLNHPRVVRLYGCTSADSPELLLVYEFVPNGSLADHLHGDRRNLRGLPWDTRLNIALQTAEALAYLHSVDPPIFHRDVKSSNILLDENFNVKVADFGLCRNVPVNASHVTTTPLGTPGYVDPEYHQYYQLTEKSDVYSFGVVLVEIISAKLAVDVNRNAREINLANMAILKIQEGALHELVDPQLEMERNHEVKVTVSAVAELAFRCLASESDDRPDMKEVVAQLEVIRGMSGVCPSPHEPSQSLPTHKHWRSFPTSRQLQWPILNSPANASA